MAEDQPATEILKQLVERLDLLERVLGSNTARLHGIEQHLKIAEPVPQPPPPRPEQTPLTLETPPTHSWINEPAAPRPYAPREATAPHTLHSHVETPAAEHEAESAGAVREEKRRDLENLVGGSWFNWIGIIAVIFGVAFFLKFAFDKQWIGPGGRVSLAALVGIVLLYVGERLRKRGLKSYANVLSGGGILILYLANYAAFNFYQLIGQTPAFLLMSVVTATAVLLSVRLNALPVAILGLIGGFLTPLLLSTGVDNQVALFTYVALLDAGVLALAYFKRWRSLDFLSFFGTIAMTVGWSFKFFTPEKIWTTLFFLSVFFLLYSLLPIFHNVLRARLTRWFDLSLALANATFYFGFSYVLLTRAGLDQATPATQALLVSIYFIGLFYTTWRWSSEDLLLRYSYVGAAATFLTLALAIQLELHWVTITWGVEALVLTWLGLRFSEKGARHAAVVLFCLAVSHWFLWDMGGSGYAIDPSFVPLLNLRALSCAVLVGAMAAAAWLYRRAGELDEDERSAVKAFLTLAGNAMALTVLSLDINDYFIARGANNTLATTGLFAPIESARQFSISALWTLYAATLLTIGLRQRSLLLRWSGLVVLLAAIGKVVAVDSTFYAAPWHFTVFNLTFIAFALLVAVLAFAAWLYAREAPEEPEWGLVRPGLIVAANVLALTALSLEGVGYYDRGVAFGATGILGEFEEGKIFALAVIWTIYATGAFMFGVWRDGRAWRIGGLLLLTLTTPLVLITLGYYGAAWHVFIFNRTLAAFAIFVAALWLVVRSYARSGEKFAEAPLVRPVATVAANLLAIIALTAQAAGYYEAKIAEEYARSGAAVLAANGFPAPLRNLELAKQLSLSVVWALYASGLLVVGHLRRLRLLRVMGLALLVLTTVKAFLWDVSSLDRIYRIISFIMLGAILLVVSYFYQRSQQPPEERFSEQ